MPHLANPLCAASTSPDSSPKDSFQQCGVPATFSCMSWPKTVPDDLRRKLEAVLGYRNRPAPQDIWGAVLEWLEATELESPSKMDASQALQATSDYK